MKALELKAPFTETGYEIQNRLLNHFTMLLREELLETQRVKKKVKVFRPLFVNTWMLTLQLYITERKQFLDQVIEEDDSKSKTSRKPME